jgi:hypothetical protein
MIIVAHVSVQYSFKLLFKKMIQMDKITSLEFSYKSKMYYALVRTKPHERGKMHSITIMNGDLERLLYGHHVIIEKEGLFVSVSETTNKEIIELKQCIINALSRLMNADVFG